MRYLYYHVRQKDRQSYVMHAHPDFVDILFQTAINLIYCRKNNLKLTASQIRRLRKNKKLIKQLINAKTMVRKRKLLSPHLIHLLLSIITDVISRMNLPI